MNPLISKMTRISLAAAMVVLFFPPQLHAQTDAASLYKSKCAMCHGADGKGTAVGKKLGVRDFASPEVRKETDKELIEITSKGKNKMPGYEKTLKESQIKELVGYIRELAKEK
jgi:cytochrome c6